VFGAISLDGRQFFRQYDVLRGKTFLDYIRKIHRNYGKLYLFMDRAKQHYDTDIVTEYLRTNRKTLRWIPTASPEFNMLEECWREGENNPFRLPVFTTAKRAQINPCEVLSDEKVFNASGHEEIPFDKQRIYELMTARLGNGDAVKIRMMERI
jgi:hypothetical protein